MQDEKTFEFLKSIKDLGNWNEDYDYSSVNFTVTKSKVVVIYKPYNTKHTVFPSQLKKGVGLFLRNAIDKTEFAKKVIQEKNNLDLNLDEFQYIDDRYKFKIECPKHKLFFTTNYGSLIRGSGCKQCGIDKASKKIPKVIHIGFQNLKRFMEINLIILMLFLKEQNTK